MSVSRLLNGQSEATLKADRTSREARAYEVNMFDRVVS